MNYSQSAPSFGGGGVEERSMHKSGTDEMTPALYNTPSYASLYADVEDLEPGPGSYDVPPGLGVQHESMKNTIPAISLTARHQKSWSKVLITKDHLQELRARDTPGPGSYQPSHLATEQSVRFGTSKRRPLNDTTNGAPGPALYNTRGDITTDGGMGRIKFGKAGRFAQDAVEAASIVQTWPGQYESGTVFDGLRLSKSFGVSHRAYDKVRFPGADRLMYGRLSPGPGPYRPYQPGGREYSFSKANRLGMADQGRGPGPGQYDNHERPPPDSRNRPVNSFGKPSAKSRLSWQGMRNHGNGERASTTWGVF